MKESIPQESGNELQILADERFKALESLYSSSISDEMYDFLYDFKLRYRLFKKSIRKFFNNKKDVNFTNIVYLTYDCPLYTPGSERLDSPVDFISEMRKQYPDTNICLLIPIIGLSKDTKISKKMTLEVENIFYNLEKTSINFDFFAQNSVQECSLYRYNTDKSHISVYGIYSPSFSYLTKPEMLKSFDKKVLLLRAARTIIKYLHKEWFKPDIVHSELLPFYMGAEFEKGFPENIRVFQVFDNFANSSSKPQDAFWSILNMADKEGIKKIYRDAGIQNCISRLFNFPIKTVAPRMNSFISLIFDNYKMFNGSSAEDYKSKGRVIFKHLNDRAQKLFPNIIKKEGGQYCQFSNTILNSDFWAVYSETYYKDLYEKKLATKNIIKEINRTASKSGFIQPTISTKIFNNKSEDRIYNEFDLKSFREERIKNKKNIIKEFSSDSIKTNFIDKTLFKNYDNVKIYGYLDSFYNAPLLFASPDPEVFTEGVDILLNTILKLFERNRNIQIIVSIKNGLKQDYIKSIIDFLNGNKIFMGKWVYVDGEINLPKILSAADIYLHPARICDKSIKHLLGIHYGCVPVVSNSGILNDTVTDIFDNIVDGNGFKLKDCLLYEDENTNVYINYLEKALELFNNNRSCWHKIMGNALSYQTDWNFPKLEHYYKIYRNIL